MHDLPVMMPMTHHESGFPGVSRYPIDEWEQNNSPMITVAGWCKLAMKIASKDLDNLQDVFDIAQVQYNKEKAIGKEAGIVRSE